MVAALLAPSAAVTGAATAFGAHPLLRLASSHTFAAPPTTADCEAEIEIACYSPKQIETAYDTAPLYKSGDTGAGQTIAIVDPFGSPTISTQLATFDKAFGLPAPPSLKIIAPVGAVTFDPDNATDLDWALETSLDVEYSHAIAPGAKILLVETPAAETEGTVGFPKIVAAENIVVKNHLADVISQSFDASEGTFPNAQSLLKLRGAYVNAEADGVSVLAASGDSGATNYSNVAGTKYYLHDANSWPSSDPLVTSVGGTQLHLTSTGAHIQPDTVWNDTNLLGSPAASGGGPSAIFSKPAFQDGIVTGENRSTPDISMSAAVDGGVLVYLSAEVAPGNFAGYYIVGGTSEATPEFAGIVALATQAAGHSIGYLNPLLYKLSTKPDNGIVDVTSGTNTVSFAQSGTEHTVVGRDAVVGYDGASGLGTVDAAVFVPALAALANSTTGS